MSAAAARLALQKLLGFAESATIRGARARGLVFASFAAYRLDSVQALEAVHTELAAAERAGAIAIEWDRRAGDRGQVTRIDVVDAEILAGILGVTPHWRQLEQARAALAPWLGRWSIDWLLRQWADGKSPRERGPEAALAFVEAAWILDALAAGGDRISMRRLSAQLFGDSKRIEARAVELDLLTRSDDGPARSDQALFSEIGLLHYPLPFLIAGEQCCAILDADQRQAIPKPYLGFDPAIIQGVVFDGGYVLSVENLTTFNELSRGQAGRLRGLLLYTGGMPGPAWTRAYACSIRTAQTPIYHWGDTDVGGIRVLAKLDAMARTVGKTVQPWQMGVPPAEVRKPLGEREVGYMRKVCGLHHWHALGELIGNHRAAIEQEAQELVLPPA